MRHASERRPPGRPFRPPDWQPCPPYRQQYGYRPRAPAAEAPAPPPRRRKPFDVLLLRGNPATSTADVESVVSSLPSAPPDELSFHSSGRLAACLSFWSVPLAAAAAAAAAVWSLRLDGTHLLTPHLPDPALAAEARPLISSLFASHAERLLHSDLVKRWEATAASLATDIRKISQSLGQRNDLAAFERLMLRKRAVEAEKELVVARIAEFRAAIESIQRGLLGGKEHKTEGEAEEEGVEVLSIGEAEEVDFLKLHGMMLRECRRLKDGLPIYAYRRRILNHIHHNQVMVLIGETGSGKSTQLVQFLADSGLAASGSIVCTQPRKVAALSLAQRVGEESNGCYKDNFVVSYPTFLNSQDFSSKIVFTTDHCLLQHYMNGGSLGGISYIIVDEAHERSLNTDLLLALIKKMLLQRMDLRLIIMSATADANKLADYFDGCSRFNVKGRNFPVEIKYVPDVAVEAACSTAPKLVPASSSFASYVYDVVRMVGLIHKNEEDGAILAFLTSQVEVEWACENFNDPNAVVLPMHGKLSFVEQSLVFKSYPGKRKVIFCTNIAETSLTIKGVKYVVDPGLVKESRFEPSTGMNVLKVNWISKSSANQRSGRAGRTGAGKCYRLYSESDFELMRMHQEPEIRKVHLGTAVLRILALGITDARNFEFVDAPNQEAIDMAMKNLEQLGAVIHMDNGFELTDSGRHLVKLEVEPRLGKIMLDCFSHGLRKEGVVLAAVMANSSSIFCRVGTNEEKYKADRLKVPFCHPDGDLFTLLSVYKKWEEERENKNSWCWQNSINAKSLRRCQETISELENCLKHELNIIVPSYWCWNPEEPTVHDKSLKRIILASLAGNLAFFSGHEKLGYQVASTDQVVQLHPSSSLLVYDSKPQWVVFTEILSVSNQYLVCVTAVDRDALCTVQPLSVIQQLERHKLQMKVISGFGSTLLKRFCGKSCQNLQRIISILKKDCMDDRITVEIDFGNNEVLLFATEHDMERVISVVSSALERETKWLMNECYEKSLFPGRPGSSPTIALFGSGAEIKHLELEKRYLTVEVMHPNAYALDDKELICLVDTLVPGIVNFHKLAGSFQTGTDATKWGRLTFLKPEHAEDAVYKLNEVEFHGSLLKAVPVCVSDYRGLPFPAVRVKVSWPRRPSRGVALVTCARGEAEFIVRDCFALGVGGKYINCEISTKYQNCIFVTGIPRDVSEQELYDAFHSATTRKILDIHLIRGTPISNHPIAAYAEALRREISMFMPNKNFPDKNFRVEVFPPEEKDYVMKATITFDGSLHLEAAKALDHLQGGVLPGFLPWQKIECQHVFHSTVSCPARVYHVISQPVASLLESFRNKKGVSYNLEKNENGCFRVKVTANATKIIADLRRPLELLMKGKTISHPNLTVRGVQLLLSHDGVSHLKAVERETGTYILYDRQNLKIKVFGPPTQVAKVEEKLVHALQQLHEKKQLEICLRGRTLPPNLMKEVIKRFGVGLEGLKKEVPAVEATLNTRRHILYVRGSKEEKQKVEEMISELVISSNHNALPEQPPESENSCPICLCDLEDPYKLEACGHIFCQACLVDQCESAMKSQDGFPLCCLKEGCHRQILLVDLRSLLSGAKLEELFRASLSVFVSSSAGTYRFCPTPDCPSIYQVAPVDAEASPFICGACSVETCTKCHLEYHPFISCETYMEYKEDPDATLVEWRKGKENVKSCPACRYTIEKTEGCDHIECRCGCHICWVCLEYFKSPDGCYGHIRSMHPSY